jgi:hypothetical protein
MNISEIVRISCRVIGWIMIGIWWPVWAFHFTPITPELNGIAIMGLIALELTKKETK